MTIREQRHIELKAAASFIGYGYDIIGLPKYQTPEHISSSCRDVLGISPEKDVCELPDETREELGVVMSGVRDIIRYRREESRLFVCHALAVADQINAGRSPQSNDAFSARPGNTD